MARETATPLPPWTVRDRWLRTALKTSTAALGLGLLVLAAGPAVTAEQGKLVRVTPGKSPFADCKADKVSKQEGINYPNTEIEPFVDVNPADRKNLIAVWQQDRWDNGGARGDLAGYSKDGGRTWTTVVPPGITLCSGGKYARASDPWVSISPYGTAYFMSLAFDPDLTTPSGEFAGFGDNAMLVSRSTDGGASWGKSIALIEDTDPQILNDKNSLTADPTNPSYAYAVWDRLRDFSVPPEEPEAAGAAALRAGGTRHGMDGVAIARERVRRQKAEAAAAGAAQADAQAAPAQLVVEFEGPATFTRTIDGGDSWEPPKVIYNPGPNAQTIGNLVAVPPNGNVIDFFVDIPPNGVLRLALLRSFDKGATFETSPTYIENVSFSLTGTITPDLQEPVRDAAILFDVAVDPHRGTLYLVWQDVRFRRVDEVAFAQSSDNGLTWSIPVRVNQTPVDAENPLRQQAFVPSIEVGAGGELVVTYYDFRNDSGEGGELTDYWAVFCSADCGKRSSWGHELRLTKKPFDMLDAPIAVGHFLGDYMGLAAAGDVAHPVFGIAEAPDRTSLYTRRIRLGGAGKVAALP